MRLAGASAAWAIALVTIGPTAHAAPHTSPAPETPVEIRGIGAAHGFGMAMDGVEGQARAGWTSDRILDLFYPGTQNASASGTIRVGLATTPAPAVTLPAGGFVSDAPRGNPGGAGFPVRVPAGAKIAMRAKDGGIEIAGGLGAPPAKTAAAQPQPASAQQEPPRLIPTAPPVLAPTPAPGKRKAPAEPAPAVGGGPAVLRSVWVWGDGDPALVGVEQTGRRYRGTIEVKPGAEGLVVVNHVPLETYVAGIAEEKGQGWPDAGLQALAVAARTLGAATMSWYDKNQANGYDICPNANCQLYLGYDGEEPAMSRAVAATAGRIRAYRGRPILAMYHGNGGGQTESYRRAIDNGTDPYPYLTSVEYPFAAPSRWTKTTTIGGIEAALRANEIGVDGAIERIEVVERGESPRVLRVRITSGSGSRDVSGTRFADALELRSTWFDLDRTDAAAGSASAELFAAPGGVPLGGSTVPPAGDAPWIAVALGAAGLLALALRLRVRSAFAETGHPEQLQGAGGDVGEHL